MIETEHAVEANEAMSKPTTTKKESSVSSSSKSTAATEADCCGCLTPCTRGIDGAISRGFHKWGHFVGHKPWTAMLISLVIIFACCAGFLNFYNETDNAKLWVPQGTEGQINSADFSDKFSDRRVNRFTIAAKTEGGNVLEKSKLIAAYHVVEAVLAINVTEENSTEIYNFADDLGQRVIPSVPAFPLSLLGLWESLEELESQTQEEIMTTINSGSEVLLEGLGRDQVDENGDIVSAEAYSVIFFLTAEANYTTLAEEWEDKMLDICLDGTEFERVENDENPVWFEEIRVFPFAQRTFADEFGSVVTGDLSLLGLSFAMITAYVIVNFGNCDAVTNKLALSFLVILTIFLAIGAGFGVSAGLGFAFGPLHSVLPFVILGIGVDNCFVTVNAFELTPVTESLAIRSARSLRHAGASLVVTSATDIVAFAVGSVTSLPALSSFCTYAAFTITFVFLITISFFQACIVLDHKRQDSNRFDCCCCFSSSKERTLTSKEEHRGAVSRFLEHTYGPFITSKAGIACALIFAALCCAGGVYGFLQLEVQSTQSSFIPDDSYAKASLNFDASNFNSLGDDVYVVIKGDQFDHFKNQAVLDDIWSAFNKTEYSTDLPLLFQPPEAPWTSVLKTSFKWNPAINVTTDLDENGYVKDEELYYKLVQDVIDFPFASIGGDVKMKMVDGKPRIERSKFNFKHLAIGDFVDGTTEFKPDTARQVKAMEKMYELVAEVVPGAPEGSIYAFSRIYVNEWETFRVVRAELVQNLSLALLCVFVITVLLIGHPVTSLFVFICVLLTVVELLGVTWAWGLAIDTVAVVNAVVSIGLSVDYACHLGHCIMTYTGTRSQRVMSALGDIGAPVLNGAISTILAICLLGASKSYVFRVLFQQLFAAAVLGMINGMVTLPALMALAAPPSYKEVIEYDDSESHDEEDVEEAARKSSLASAGSATNVVVDEESGETTTQLQAKYSL